MVEDGEVGGEEHPDLGQVELVATLVGDVLPAADGVVGDGADHPAGERREPRDAVGGERLERQPEGLGRVAVGRDADGRLADPVRLPVALGEGGPAAGADDGVARPDAAVLGRLEEERAGGVARELAVDAERGLGVGEQPPDDGDDAAVAGEHGEQVEAGPGLAPGEVGGDVSASACPGVASSGWVSKQECAPVWQAGPTWSTRTRRASPSQSSADGPDPLHVPGGVALAPQLLPAARPERHPAGRQGAGQRLVVHPADHEHAPVSCCWTTAATRPAASRLSSAATSGSSWVDCGVPAVTGPFSRTADWSAPVRAGSAHRARSSRPARGWSRARGVRRTSGVRRRCAAG